MTPRSARSSPGDYSAAAYACAQVILDAFKHVGTPDRAAIRAYITSGATFDTVLGTLHFDANGDSSQQIISEYRFDPSLNGGDWAFVKQVDVRRVGERHAEPDSERRLATGLS